MHCKDHCCMICKYVNCLLKVVVSLCLDYVILACLTAYDCSFELWLLALFFYRQTALYLHAFSLFLPPEVNSLCSSFAVSLYHRLCFSQQPWKKKILRIPASDGKCSFSGLKKKLCAPPPKKKLQITNKFPCGHQSSQMM